MMKESHISIRLEISKNGDILSLIDEEAFMDSVEKIEKILKALSNGITNDDNSKIVDGIICDDALNSFTHAYSVYTERLENIIRENKEIKELVSELNDDEKERLYDYIWKMAQRHVSFIVVNYADDICDDDDEEEELWI